MKKISYVLLAGVLSTTAFVSSLNAAKKSEAVAQKEEKIEVKKSQMDKLQNVVRDLIDAAKTVSGPEELFKYISGETQTNDRETPIVGAVNAAKSHGLRIVCYIEGNENIAAASNPELIGKPVGDFKTAEGMVVRDKAVEELKKSPRQATFTYARKSQMDGSAAVVENRVVVAIGREAFDSMKNSEKKFLITVSAEVDQ